jgi:hypothetical protein
MAVAISDIGKEVRSILYGAKDGVFQYDQKLSYSTRTADGVQLVLNAIRKDEKADLSLRTVYNYGNYGLNATFTTSDKVHVLASVDKIAPGVKVSLSATLPDKDSGKLLVDYINQVGSKDTGLLLLLLIPLLLILLLIAAMLSSRQMAAIGLSAA